MKLRRCLTVSGSVLALGLTVVVTPGGAASAAKAPAQPRIEARSATLLHRHGLTFKDLDGNGRLDPYEDWRLTPAKRARDLVGRMTLEEKAATMVHGTLPTTGGAVGTGTDYDMAGARHIIQDLGVTSAITRLSDDPSSLAKKDNALQRIAESGRLGIPLTISSDPRNSFQYVPGASVQSGGFSQWPETTGLAATRDVALVQRFGDIARREYRAVGIQMALSPQADVATEPRWARINGTFGEDPAVVRAMAGAYVRGFQGGRGVHPDSVLTVVKHWGGYGAQENGFDSHNAYGKYATFTSNRSFRRHLDAFKDAFSSGAAGVMPTYSIIKGVTVDGKPREQVGAGYNKQMLTDLLRRTYGFRGVVLSDWGITSDCDANCENGWPAGQTPGFVGFGTPWGMENATLVERYAKGINAGLDQFGGTEDWSPIVQAVAQGKVSVARINASVQRILTQKFEQGLFEDPYVSPAAAARIVGNARFQAQATKAQEHGTVLLKNARVAKHAARALPARRGSKVYLYGVDAAAAKRAGYRVVSSPQKADFALARTSTPYETLHPQYTFGSLQHEGNLAFEPGQKDFDAIAKISAQVPTIVSVYMDRPAILTQLKPKASAILANFGLSDDALFALVSGKARPEGKLPFELPRSMAAVEKQKSDLPADSAHPLYRLGYGMRY